MRDKVNVFYYPSMVADSTTLKRAILLFDELHFIDRPSFMFGDFGTAGTSSPLRAYEQAFRDGGIPLYVHSPKDGPVQGEFLEQVRNDINDFEFLKRFQNGLTKSLVFRNQQIAPGNWGEVGNENDVAREIARVDLNADLAGYSNTMDLVDDRSVPHFRFRTDAERAKALVSKALSCSAMINFALNASQRKGLVPLADAGPYQDLIGAKYGRAARALQGTTSKIQLTDLSFAIFDELVPAERVEMLSFKAAADYRKEAATAREAFLEHLAVLQSKQGAIDESGDYAGAIKGIVVGDIIPAAREFKNGLDAAHERLFGKLVSSALGYLSGTAGLQILGDLSWIKLLQLAGLAGGAIGAAAIEAKQAVKAARRECAISYVLDLDK